jgi:hypothetical protein
MDADAQALARREGFQRSSYQVQRGERMIRKEPGPSSVSRGREVASVAYHRARLPEAFTEMSLATGTYLTGGV